jgi:TonB family protein
MFARPRPAPFALSALIHGWILGWVGTGPLRDSRSLYQQEIAPHADKLVWYDFREKLPNVSPATAHKALQPLRAETKIASQEIVAGSASAPHAQQFVWQPAPKIQLKEDLQAPNLVALHLPHMEPPPKPKVFVPPPEPKRATETPSLAAPPKLQAMAVPARAPLNPTLPRPQPKPFTPPEEKKPVKPAAALDAPPEVRLASRPAGTLGNLLGAQPAAPQRRAFTAPVAGQPRVDPTPALPAPPDVQTAANAPPKPVAGAQVAMPARRQFVPPTVAAKSAPGAAPALPGAPALPTSTAHGAVSLAIVGLKPAAAATVPLPEGSRNAQLSGGPKQRAGGGADGASEGALLTVPGLLIRNSASNPQQPVAAGAAPTSQQNLQAAIHGTLPAPLPTDGRPVAIRVATAPDPMLAGRDIYAMSVQMPNTTSYSGSWMIWFAEREQQFGQSGGLRPPLPLRKVDPKYVASAVLDRIEGKVRLAAVIRKDGHVDSVKLLRPLDDRLDKSAEEAIDKWLFEPALHNGKPVEVDAVIEIPFRLAPPPPR